MKKIHFVIHVILLIVLILLYLKSLFDLNYVTYTAMLLGALIGHSLVFDPLSLEADKINQYYYGFSIISAVSSWGTLTLIGTVVAKSNLVMDFEPTEIELVALAVLILFTLYFKSLKEIIDNGKVNRRERFYHRHKKNRP